MALHALFLLPILPYFNFKCLDFDSKILKEQLDTAQHYKLSKVEEELFYFFVFALDYWFQISPNRTQEERNIFGQVFITHLANIVALHALEERFVDYRQIVNENMDDKFKYSGLAKKLSEFCDISLIYTMILAPSAGSGDRAG